MATPGHTILNVLVVGALFAAVYTSGDPMWRSPNAISRDMLGVDWSKFPDHYQPQFDFVKHAMNPTLAWIICEYFPISQLALDRVACASHTVSRVVGSAQISSTCTSSCWPTTWRSRR